MSRRGRTAPAISLFAFQDIITSVTAIIIVVVLCLALDLAQRKQTSASESASALTHAIRERIDALQIEITRLRQETDRANEVVQGAAIFSPAELRAEIAQREITIKNLLDMQRRQVQADRDLKAKELIANAEKFDLEPTRKLAKQTVQEAQSLAELLEAERQEGRVIFALPRGFTKSGWLAVVENDRISLAQLGRVSKPQIFEASKGLFLNTSAADEVSNWIDREHQRSAYFLVLVRPSGCRTFDTLEGVLHSKGVAFGFDVIDDDQAILHPERGAGI